MCMNPVEVKELCRVVVDHIERCECSAKLSPLKEPPYVPPLHQSNLTTLACVVEVLARSINGVLYFPDKTFNINAINHSFEGANREESDN